MRAEHAQQALKDDDRFDCWRASFYKLFPLYGDTEHDTNNMLQHLQRMIAGYATWVTMLGLYVTLFALQSDTSVTVAIKTIMGLGNFNPQRTQARLVKEGQNELGTETTVGLLHFVWRTSLLLHNHMTGAEDKSLAEPHDHDLTEEMLGEMEEDSLDVRDAMHDLHDDVRDDLQKQAVDKSYGSIDGIPETIANCVIVRESTQHHGFGPFVTGLVRAFTERVLPMFKSATEVRMVIGILRACARGHGRAARRGALRPGRVHHDQPQRGVQHARRPVPIRGQAVAQGPVPARTHAPPGAGGVPSEAGPEPRAPHFEDHAAAARRGAHPGGHV